MLNIIVNVIGVFFVILTFFIFYVFLKNYSEHKKWKKRQEAWEAEGSDRYLEQQMMYKELEKKAAIELADQLAADEYTEIMKSAEAYESLMNEGNGSCQIKSTK